MIYIQFVILAMILMVIYKISKSTTNVAFVNQEQFFDTKPILTELPKQAIKNSHWFTHTFMRSRRKG